MKTVYYLQEIETFRINYVLFLQQAPFFYLFNSLLQPPTEQDYFSSCFSMMVAVAFWTTKGLFGCFQSLHWRKTTRLTLKQFFLHFVEFSKSSSLYNCRVELFSQQIDLIVHTGRIQEKN